MSKRSFSRYVSNWRALAAVGFFAFAWLVAIPTDVLAASENQRKVFSSGISQYNTLSECSESLALTEDQRISASFIIGFDGNSTAGVLEIVKQHKIGGIYTTGSNQADLNGYDKTFYDSLADSASHPMIIANDNEGGSIKRDSFTITESAQDLAQMSDDQISAKVSAMAIAMQNNGENTNLAPVLDFSSVGTTGRNFASDPDQVKAKAGIYATALSNNGITPVFKHFPGFDSSVSGNTDQTAVSLPTDLDTLKNRNIKPYSLANEITGSMIMLSNLYTQFDPTNIASTSKTTVDYIRNELGFRGVIMTDSLSGPSRYAGDLPKLVTNAIVAGVTMPMFEYTAGVDLAGIVAAVKANPEAMANVNKNLQILYGSSIIYDSEKANTASTSLAGSLPTSLSGEDNQQKVWNYFKARGLSDIAAAGAMGNIKAESGFNPFLLEAGGSGWGIIQWTPASSYNRNAESGSPLTAGASSGDNDLYLLWQLHALWKRAGETFWEKLNQETSVGSYQDPIPAAKSAGGTQFSGDYQGEGSAYYFHAAIERSADMDWGLNSSGKPNSAQNGHGNIRNRPYYAAEILEKYGGGGADNCGNTTESGDFLDDSKWIYFSQGDPKTYYNSSSPQEGCLPTSMSMIIANLLGDRKLTPKQINDETSGDLADIAGTTGLVGGEFARSYQSGFSFERLGDIGDVKAAFQKGALVLANVSSKQTPIRTASTGHFVVIRGVTSDGKWKVADPGKVSEGTGTTGLADFSEEDVDISLKSRGYGNWAAVAIYKDKP